MNKKLLTIFGLTLSVLVAAYGVIGGIKPASAVTGSDWRAGRIIDDAVFFNAYAMDASTIQAFLSAKVPACDSNGDQPYPGYANRRAYASANGVSTPFICLKDYTQNTPTMPANSYCINAYNGGSKTAAQIIKDVSVACAINPQVLLVLLQKEQSLITDDWPWPIQYNKATGFSCPDTAPCDPAYAGFFYQVYYAARQFQRYAKEPSSFNYRAGQNNFISYQANSPGCGGTNVFIENQATAGLYNYTPYQPNQAALNNLYGTGDGCSAYGNRNFWRMFNDWFGSTTGPDYSWLIESFSYANGDNVLTQGQSETLTLRARNTGRQPWYNHGSHPIRLGTWLPDRKSSVANGAIRFATLQENVVNPWEIGTFTFQVSPQNLGTFVEAMNLVVENHTWMAWPGFSPTIKVTNNPYQWQIQQVIYGNGTGLMDPAGGAQLITLKARNTGNTTWSKLSGPKVRVGTWLPDRPSAVGSGWMSNTRAVDMNENTVAPGSVAGFQFYVRTPNVGNFYERLNLVAEGQAWFNDPGLTLYLQGKSYSGQAQWTSISTGSTHIQRSTEFTITAKIKNTGQSTWTKNGSFPVRLGTANPLNRGSNLYHSSWLSDIRPTGLVEPSVAPGQEGTFTFTAKTPSTPGLRYESFRLVAEGLTWLSAPQIDFYINVL